MGIERGDERLGVWSAPGRRIINMKNCIEKYNATSNQDITITQEEHENYLRWLPGTRIKVN
jgi:hypothetical protein